MSELKRQAMSGMIWGYAQRFGGQFLQLITSMVLTRLLMPAEYGLLAMSLIFTGIASVIADSGFSSALIQKKEADQLDYDTVYWFNKLLCSGVYLLLFFTAPYVSQFFGDDRLTLIVRVSSLGVLIGSFGAVHQTILTKELVFKPVVIRNLIVQAIAGVVGIALALLGYGVWALVYQALTAIVLQVITVWFISWYRPKYQFSYDRLRRLFHFGSKLMASGLLDYGFTKTYDVIFGKFYSSVELALYNRSNSTANIFRDSTYGVLSSLLFPIFSRMQEDVERLRLNVQRFLMIVGMLMFFVMLLMIVLGEPLFQLMFSSRWDAAIPYFKVSCLIAMMYPLHAINLSILNAKGRSDLFLRLEIIKKVLMAFSIFFAYQYGVYGMFYSLLGVNVLAYYLNTYYTAKIIDYSIKDQLKDLFPYLWSAVLIVSVVMVEDYYLKQLFMRYFDTFTHLFNGQLLNLLRLLVGGGLGITLFVIYHRSRATFAYTEALRFAQETMGSNRLIRLLMPPSLR